KVRLSVVAVDGAPRTIPPPVAPGVPAWADGLALACGADAAGNPGSILSRSAWASSTSPRSPARTSWLDTGPAFLRAAVDDLCDVLTPVTSTPTRTAAAAPPATATSVHRRRRVTGVDWAAASTAAATAAARLCPSGGG